MEDFLLVLLVYTGRAF